MLQTPLLRNHEPSEREILRQVRAYLRFHNWFVVRLHQGLGAHKGLADLVAIKNGRVIWLEIKTQRGRLSPHQEQFQRDVEEAGGQYLVVHSVEELEQKINDFN